MYNELTCDLLLASLLPTFGLIMIQVDSSVVLLTYVGICMYVCLHMYVRTYSRIHTYLY